MAAPRMYPPPLFLFGQIGAGKSFCGEILAREFGYTFYEGDDDITPAMRHAIAVRAPFTPEMRREFVDRLATRMLDLVSRSPRVCIAQGLFKNSERHRLRASVPGLAFVWIKADSSTIKLRLGQRVGHVADADYAEFANPYFEAPDFSHHAIVNDPVAAPLIEQLGALLSCLPVATGSMPAPTRAS